jgi:hypothetical protein
LPESDAILDHVRQHYRKVEVVYWGLPQSDQMFPNMDGETFMKLCRAEMETPNIPGEHRHFYLCARDKVSPAAATGPLPDMIDEGGLFIVKSDIPHLRLDG